MPRFAAIGLDHRHIYDLTQDLLDEGAECVGYNPDTTDPRVLAGFRKRFPLVPQATTERLLDDLSIDFVVIAARPCDRAELAIRAMRHGKDVMVDKPGITTPEQLVAVERVVAETKRIWSVCIGRLASPAVQEALRIVRSGELGRVVHTTSLAPHRLNRALRPAWFFDQPAYGGIINDIGVHSIDQFLAFADADDAGIEHAAIGAFGTEPAGFRGFRGNRSRDAIGARLHAAGLVHARWIADVGRWAVLRGGHRRDAGTAQEPGYRGARRDGSYVRREPCGDTLCRLWRNAGDVLPRLPARHC